MCLRFDNGLTRFSQTGQIKADKNNQVCDNNNNNGTNVNKQLNYDVKQNKSRGTCGTVTVQEKNEHSDSFIHSDNYELCLSQEWPITNLTNTSKLKWSNTNRSSILDQLSSNLAAGHQQKGFSFLLSEYVSIHKNDTLPTSPTVAAKAIKYLHKKRLEERGFRMTNKKLGEGGFGAVYKIYSKNDNNAKPLACKIMMLSKDDKLKKEKNSMLQAYSNEIYVLKSTMHENVVAIKANFIYSHGQSIENISMSHSYIIMEFASMGTLYSKLKKHGPFTDNTSRYYFTQITEALLHLHKRGIAHRDLKLGNILLTRSENCQEIVKLTDFGLSRLVNSTQSGLTKFAKPAGTISYMSPQIISCYIHYNTGNKSAIRAYDPFKADTWALGVCLFLMLSKIHPFENPPSNKSERVEFAKRMLEKQKNKDWQIPMIIRQCTSEQCVNLLNYLLEPNSKKRFNIYKITEHDWNKMEIQIL